MIITIDGPAGAGKSTIARNLADQLGFAFLDTGAMYRAVALAVTQAGIDLDDPNRLIEIARQTEIAFEHSRVLLNGKDVTQDIRQPQLAQAIHAVADHTEIRDRLVQLQRHLAHDHDTVTEGRDQGTVAFPHAEIKFFLTASPDVRAQRRTDELQRSGKDVSFEEVLRLQNERDHRDAIRPVGALVMAEDAIPVDTDDKSPEQVVQHLVELVQKQRQQRSDEDSQHHSAN